MIDEHLVYIVIDSLTGLKYIPLAVSAVTFRRFLVSLTGGVALSSRSMFPSSSESSRQSEGEGRFIPLTFLVWRCTGGAFRGARVVLGGTSATCFPSRFDGGIAGEGWTAATRLPGRFDGGIKGAGWNVVHQWVAMSSKSVLAGMAESSIIESRQTHCWRNVVTIERSDRSSSSEISVSDFSLNCAASFKTMRGILISLASPLVKQSRAFS